MLKFLTNALIISMKAEESGGDRPVKFSKELRRLGVILQDNGRRAIVKSRDDSFALHSVQIVTRRSGRNTHLSRYLIGTDMRGTRHDIFIERVPSALTKISVELQKIAVRLFGAGLSYREVCHGI